LVEEKYRGEKDCDRRQQQQNIIIIIIIIIHYNYADSTAK